MHEDGHITAEEAEPPRPSRWRCAGARRDRSCRRRLLRRGGAARAYRPRFGEQRLYEGGLSVRTDRRSRFRRSPTNSAARRPDRAMTARHGWRGPVARLESFDNWSKQLAETTVPAGGEIWRLATVLEVNSRPCRDRHRRRRPGPHSADGSQVGAEMAGRRARRAGGQAGRRRARQGRRDPGRAGDQGRQGQGASGRHLRAAPDTGSPGRSGRDGPPYRPRPGDERRLQFQDQRLQPRHPGAAAAGVLLQAVRLSGGAGQRLHAVDHGPRCAVRDPPRVRGCRCGGRRTTREDFLGAADHAARHRELAQPDDRPPGADASAWTRWPITPSASEPSTSMQQIAGDVARRRRNHRAAHDRRLCEIVNGGKKIEPTLIDRVQDQRQDHLQATTSGPATAARCRHGRRHAGPEMPDARQQVLDPATAYQMVSMLEGVVQRGTGKAVKAVGKPLAGKTGTTNDANDVWFVGLLARSGGRASISASTSRARWARRRPAAALGADLPRLHDRKR